MVVTKRREEAESTKRAATTPEGLTFDVTHYFGATVGSADVTHPGLGVLHPVCVRVDQRPETVNAPHFHQANQFQVFVDGDGLVGKHRVGTVSIHYAQAFTPYGPLCSSERGMSYFVMRNTWDPIAQFMPEKRELLKAAGRKPRAVMSPLLEAPGAPPPAGVTCTPALAEERDGLAAWRYRAAPGVCFTGPDPAAGGGQFWLVLAGEQSSGTAPLTPMSCVFLSPDEPRFAGEAGPDGLDVLALQFPRLEAA